MNAALFCRVKQNDEASVLKLLARGVNPNCRDSDDFTPLHRAAYAGNANLVSILLAHGANAGAARNKSGTTPLSLAALEGLVDVAGMLLAEGARVDTADWSGLTALHFATFRNHPAMVDLLLAHGASPDAPDKTGVTPLHVAAFYYHEALAKARLADIHKTDKRRVRCAELDNAPGGHHSLIFSALLKRSSRPDMQDDSGDTPLHLAATDGYHTAICQLLGVTVEWDTANHKGFTPLHLAAREGHSDAINELLEHGFQPDAKTNFGDTPLHLAIISRQYDAVQAVLAAALKLETTNDYGLTALQLAIRTGSVEMAKTLLNNGANPNTCSSIDGSTALHVAVRANQVECIDLLFANGARTDIKDLRGDTPMAIAKTSHNSIAINKLTNPPPRYFQPQSLRQNCRATIRTRLIANRPQQSLSATINKLDCLPGYVRNYLYYPLAL